MGSRDELFMAENALHCHTEYVVFIPIRPAHISRVQGLAPYLCRLCRPTPYTLKIVHLISPCWAHRQVIKICVLVSVYQHTLYSAGLSP